MRVFTSRFLWVLLATFSSTYLSAQVTVTGTVPSVDLSACGDAINFDITLANGITASNSNSLSLVLPAGVSMAGAATYVSGASGPLVNSGTATAPVFSIVNMSGGATVVISFKLQADCSVTSATSATNTYNFTGSAGSNSYTTPTYNFQYADLNIISITNQSYLGAVGDTYTRVIRVSNGGDGSIRNFVLNIDNGAGLQIQSISGGTSTALPANDATVTVATISGIGDVNGNGFLDKNDYVDITETVLITACNNLTTAYTATYGCFAQTCNSPSFISGTANAGAAIDPNRNGNIAISTTWSNNTCWSGTTPNVGTMVLTNTGNSTTTNVLVNIFTTYDGNPGRTAWNAGMYIDTANVNIQYGASAPVKISPIFSQYPVSCGGTTLPIYTRVRVPSIAPGQSVTLTFNFYQCCNTACNGLYKAAVKYEGTFDTGCATALTLPEGSFGNRGYTGNIISSPSPTVPANLVSGTPATFYYDYQNFWMGDINTATMPLQMVITLPSNVSFSGNPADIGWLDGTGAPYQSPTSLSYVGNVITATFPMASRDYNLKRFFMVLSASCGSGGTSNISIAVSFPQAGCSCNNTYNCYTHSINVVCPGVCPNGGFETYRYSARRSSFGRPDNDNNQQPDASGSLDMTKVRLDMAAYGDTVTSILGARVIGGSTGTFSNAYIESDISQAANLAVIDAVARIYDNSGTPTYTCAGLPVVKTGNVYKVDVSPSALASCGVPGAFVYNNNDSVVLTIRYRVVTNIGGSINIATVVNNAYLSNVANPTVPQRYTCSNLNGNFQIIGFYVGLYSNPPYQTQNCDQITIPYTGPYHGWGVCCSNYSNLDVYPFEYRSSNVPVEYRYTPPVGYEVVSLRVDATVGSGPNGAAVSYSRTLTPTNPGAATLIYNFLPEYTTGGGPVPRPDDSYLWSTYVTIRPTCATPASGTGTLLCFTDPGSLGSGLTPNAFDVDMTSTHSAFYYRPDVTVASSQPTVNVNTNTAVWDIVVSNNANNSDAANVWIAENTGINGVTITSVQPLSACSSGTAGAAISATGGIYPLGSLNRNTSTCYRITATYTSCVKDSIEIAVGWNCSGYPANLAAYSCPIRTQKLYVIPQGANLSVTILNQPSAAVNLCDPMTYEFEVTNTDLGFTNNLMFYFRVPAAGTIVMNGTSQLAWPTSSGYIALPNPVKVGNIYQWTIPMAMINAGNLLPGQANSPNNSYRIRFQVQADPANPCAFASGTSFRYYASGLNPCGATFFSPAQFTAPVILNGVVSNPAIFSVTPTVGSYDGCNATTGTYPSLSTTFQITGSSATSVSDYAEIEIPDVFTINFTSIPAVLSAQTMSVSGGTRTYRWKINSGLTTGTSFTIVGNVQALSALACSPSSYPVTAQTTTEFGTVCSANGTICNSQQIIGAGSATMSIIRPNIQITSASATSVLNPPVGENLNVTVNYQNTGTASYTGTFDVNMYYDANANGAYNAGDILLGTQTSSSVTLAPSGTGTMNFTLFVPAGQVCPLVLTINPTPCHCSSSSITISNPPLATPIVTGSACATYTQSIGSAPITGYTYSWTASGNGNVSHLSSSTVSNPTVTIPTGGLATGYTYICAINRGGCTTTQTFNLSVDNVVPTISCPANISVNATAGTCGAAVTYTAPVGTDNCPGATTTQIAGLASGATFPVGTTTNTFRVTDAAGNTATCSFTVTVVDNQVPVISCPANISVNATAGTCGAAVTYTAPVGTDNCPGATTTQIAGLASGATFPVGTTTNTFRVTDAAGNTATCSFTVTVVDNQVPVISCPANISVNATAGTCGAAVTYTAPVGTDNCPGATTIQIAGLASGATFPVGTTTNTFRVTDAAGNIATCSFTVTVVDNQVPVISCPANISVNATAGTCGAAVTYTAPVGTDNCPGAVTVQTAGLASGATFPVGTTTNTFQVTDAAGNTATCSFTVTVVDNQVPVISCPANISVNATTGTCGAAVTYTAPVGTDNCPGAVTVQTAGLASGATFPVGTTTNTFQVTDAAGNTATCSFTVTVVDNQLPVISCPANISVNATAGTCGAAVTYTAPVGTDNCPGAVTVQTAGLASGATFPVGTTTNTFQVTDAAGNTATCSFTVTVVDNQLPVISCPANISVNATAGTCGAAVTYTAPVGTDNCPGATTTQIAGLASGATFPVGTTTNTFQVTDAAGNTASCSFDVVVIDAENPTISCPANISVNATAGTCGAAVTYTAPVGTDNCPGATTIQIAGLASGATFPVGTTTNTFQVTDAAGNTATCSFDVVVIDAENPTISCPANISVNATAGTCGAAVTYTAPVGTDNCPGATTIQIAGLASGATFPVGTTTNTFQVTDAAGNTATCSFDVVVIDAENPVITACNDLTLPANAAGCVLTSFPDISFTDNCSATVAYSPSGPYAVGNHTITATVTDPAGNTATCNFQLTVTGGVSVSVGADLNGCEYETYNLTATASGGLAPYNYSWDNGAGNSASATVGVFVAGTYPYTNYVTDANGCQASDALNINVQAPNTSGMYDDMQNACTNASGSSSGVVGSNYCVAPQTGINARGIEGAVQAGNQMNLMGICSGGLDLNQHPVFYAVNCAPGDLIDIQILPSTVSASISQLEGALYGPIVAGCPAFPVVGASFVDCNTANVLVGDVLQLSHTSATGGTYIVIIDTDVEGQFIFDALVLPVDLLSFTGRRVANTHLLEWETSREVNSAYFEVERSGDNQSFSKIGTKAAAGNSNTPLAYQLTDENPLEGINYYRLKMVDLDGASKYSNTVELNFERNIEFNLYPNPTDGEIHLVMEGTSGVLEFEIYDATGKKVDAYTWDMEQVLDKTLNLSHLSEGIYYYRVAIEEHIYEGKITRVK